MNVSAAQRHFTMSTLSATIAIRQYLSKHPGVDVASAATSLRRLDVDVAADDFESGVELHLILPKDITFKNPTKDLQEVLAALIDYHKPWWVKAFPYGRTRVRDMLGPEEMQCFRAAGLFHEPIPQEVVSWWDQIAQTVRARINESLLGQGREAELLSLDYERHRLTSLGIGRQPIWIAIEDNGAGYDTLSFDSGVIEPVSRLIEVKSSTQQPPMIILTRSEWEAAVQYGESYIFHVWTLPSKRLIEITVAEIARHIPHDQGHGLWNKVEIPIVGELAC